MAVCYKWGDGGFEGGLWVEEEKKGKADRQRNRPIA